MQLYVVAVLAQPLETLDELAACSARPRACSRRSGRIWRSLDRPAKPSERRSVCRGGPRRELASRGCCVRLPATRGCPDHADHPIAFGSSLTRSAIVRLGAALSGGYQVLARGDGFDPLEADQN
jgi:hypothetical protein